MTYGVYSIRDHYSVFGTPFCHSNENTARRYFARIVNNSDGDIAFTPGDYDLYRVGSFDESTGLLAVVSPAEFICNGSEMVGVGVEK